MKLCSALLLAAGLILSHAAGAESRIKIVAAENFYGDIARQIGGASVEVSSVINNPNQDPHLFEASPSIAREVAIAAIVIYNGLDYDPWMERLVSTASAGSRKIIEVAALGSARPGDNPHIWYDSTTMRRLAAALSQTLTALDSTHQDEFTANLTKFNQSLTAIDDLAMRLHQQFASTQVTATEPIFGYKFTALGLEVRDQGFQLAMMNNAEPSASDIIAFESDLKNRRVKLLVYNSQVSDPIAERMKALAQASTIPIVPVTETEPAGQSYQDWMSGELRAVGAALGAAAP